MSMMSRCLCLLAVAAPTLFVSALDGAADAALAADDQCAAGGSADGAECALSALQKVSVKRSVGVAVAEEHARSKKKQFPSPALGGLFSSERCCKCTDGTIGWSKSGQCFFCSGGDPDHYDKTKIAEKKKVQKECKIYNKNFKGKQACANECKAIVGLQVGDVSEDLSTYKAEEGATAVLAQLGSEDESIAEQDADWSPFGTTEKCCKCTTGAVGWSASGKCSFCNGKKYVKKTKSVNTDCTKKSKKFKGNTVCAKDCKKTVGLLQSDALELVLKDTEEAAMLELDAKDDSVDASEEEEAQAADWSPFGTTEKCCKCTTGVVGWSASGTCSFCNGEQYVKRTKSVNTDCTLKSKKFKGSTVCSKDCEDGWASLE